jgi:predicted dehydrogenase
MPTSRRGPIRYAVVGLGHIAQVAVLPAFAHAKRNSRLTALVSDDPRKRQVVGAKYRVENTYSYDEYEACLDTVDAVYIALPNSMHAEYTIRAARAGVHVLCEKPMAVTADECQAMIAACRQHRVKLMIAYRLHFEEINLAVIDLVRKGRIGVAKFFNSSFALTVRDGNIRTDKTLGGGTLYDIGVYCINAARHVFRSEPKEVMAISVVRVCRRLGIQGHHRRKDTSQEDRKTRPVCAGAAVLFRLHPAQPRARAVGRRGTAGCSYCPGAV